MHASSRRLLPLALAVCASAAAARPALAQDAAQAPAPAASVAPTSAPAPATAAAPTPVGPTLDAAAVGVRHAPVADETAAQRRGGYGQPMALMIVGGAAVLVGLIIGGGAGTAIAIGGAVAGLVGLYQYLQ